VLAEDGKIDQLKLDQVARLGGDWYSRVIKESLFQVAKPLTTMGIGVDALPSEIRNSRILTGNNLGQLGNVEKLPTADANMQSSNLTVDEKHLKAKALLEDGKVVEAWQVLLS
jgi:hypothetical protein